MQQTAKITKTPKTNPPVPAKVSAMIDRDQILKAIALIDANAVHHIDTLVLDLTEDHGLKLPKDKALTYTAKMHGIKAAPAALVRVALQNWANAARRALLRAEG